MKSKTERRTSINLKNKLEKSWRNLVDYFLHSEKFKKLEKFLEKEYSKKDIFPSKENIFKAFDLVPVKKVKVVIVGQDPYHTPGIAHGLSFSVLAGNKVPPSIKNIYKEIKSDLGVDKDFSKAYLADWSNQGVLLLNQVLTVEAHKPGSHWKQGWEEFTKNIIKSISSERENIVFLLWGKNAQEVEKYIKNKEKHLILKSAHPSPFSAYRGFFGNKHFSKTNSFLKRNEIVPIKW